MWVVVRIRFDKMFGKKVLVPTMHVGCSEYKRFNDLVLKKF